MIIPPPATSAMGDTYRRAVINDLVFLEAWEKGLIPYWSASSVVRVRQIRRAHLTIYNGFSAEDGAKCAKEDAGHVLK